MRGSLATKAEFFSSAQKGQYDFIAFYTYLDGIMV
jgi:hypothetical protein